MTRGSLTCWYCGRGLVAGKCAGYGGECGRYFCPAHQIGDYCQECGEREAQDERRAQFRAVAEQLWRDRQKGGSATIEIAVFAISLLFFAGGLVLALFGDLGTALLVLAGFLLLFLAAVGRQWARAYRAQAEQNRVQEIEEENPGFANFYLEWSKEKLRTSG